MHRRVHITVRGVVQGVGFRFFTEREAAALGLHGYVRNTPKGDVEVVAEGDEAALQRLIAAVRRGPAGAQVDGVDVDYSEPTNSFRGFGIRH